MGTHEGAFNIAGDGGVAELAGSPGRRDFFFQAEDGIRDLTVTGVQTCALPISLRGLVEDAGAAVETVEEDQAQRSSDGGVGAGAGPEEIRLGVETEEIGRASCRERV